MEMFREVCMTGTRAVGFAKQPRHLLCIICKQHVVAPSSKSSSFRSRALPLGASITTHLSSLVSRKDSYTNLFYSLYSRLG